MVACRYVDNEHRAVTMEDISRPLQQKEAGGEYGAFHHLALLKDQAKGCCRLRYTLFISRKEMCEFSLPTSVAPVVGLVDLTHEVRRSNNFSD